uniref:EGF-like domain-containing protein n=1 Tax=Meloidogyne javanica TaxID=6303 RepID=A0A915M3X6_MELJA
MWSTFIICYNSKLEGDDERIELKNKENGFGKKCKKPRQHAIEMSVCARRKSFERDNDKNEYKIEYNNEAISLLGLDMELWNYFSSLYDQMEFPSKSCYLTLKLDGFKFHTTTSHCDLFFTNQNFNSNRIEIWTILTNLACNSEEAKNQRLSGIEESDICVYKSDETNKMRDDYAKACKTYEEDDEFGKHGIEFRVYATRIDFKRLEEEYWVKFGVDVLCNDYSPNLDELKLSGDFKSVHKIEFNKTIKVTGKIGTYYGGERYLDLLNRTENYIKLFSIQLGNNETNFAILTDEINGNYKRPPTQCDEFGLEEYKKFNNSYYELLELYKKCNCDRVPRPPSITDDRLNVPPEARNKRSIRNESLLGTRDANGLVYGCEDSVNLGFGDILMHPTDIAQKIKKQRQCCTNGGQSRRKRQFFVMEENMNLFWNMPLSYDFSDDEGTSDYPFKSTLSKSINLECDIKDYGLDYGKCKNGGYPDPLEDCKCRCPDGYDGDDCKEYKHDNCKVIELTAKVKKQYISAEFGKGKCFFAIKLDKTDDRIQAKRILLNIEKMKGYNCDTTCKNNYIEIKYRKDKSATGARICCIDYARILTISSEEDTEVLIMKKGNIGEYDISYQKGGLFN